MIKFLINKSTYYELLEKSNKEADFNSLKKEVLVILKKQAKEETKEVAKALKEMESKHIYLEKSITGSIIEKSGYPVGTIRVWKGQRYIKVAPNKWKPQYDNESRGAKNSVTRLIHEIENCKDINELMNLVMENKQRFTDANGLHLPIVDKIRAAADKRNEEILSGKISSKTEKESKAEPKSKTKGIHLVENKIDPAAKERALNKIAMAKEDIDTLYKDNKANLENHKADYRKLKTKVDQGLKHPSVLSQIQSKIDEAEALEKVLSEIKQVDNYKTKANSYLVNQIKNKNSKEEAKKKQPSNALADNVKNAMKEPEKKELNEVDKNNSKKNSDIEIKNAKKWDISVDDYKAAKEIMADNEVAGRLDKQIKKLIKNGHEIFGEFSTNNLLYMQQDICDDIGSKYGVSGKAISYIYDSLSLYKIINKDVVDQESGKLIKEYVKKHLTKPKNPTKADEFKIFNINELDRNKPDNMKLTDFVQQIIESEFEKHQNRSDAMKGNKNAYKGGLKEFIEKFGKIADISEILKNISVNLKEQHPNASDEKIKQRIEQYKEKYEEIIEKICNSKNDDFQKEYQLLNLTPNLSHVNKTEKRNLGEKRKAMNQIQNIKGINAEQKYQLLEYIKDMPFDKLQRFKNQINRNDLHGNGFVDIVMNSPNIKINDDGSVFVENYTKQNGIGYKFSGLREKTAIDFIKWIKNNPKGKSDSENARNGSHSSIADIKKNYQSSKSVEGWEDTININGEEISGKWKIVEADAPTASHDEKTFSPVEALTKNGSTINDRDYAKDKSAQEAVINMGKDFDSRALDMGSPVVVTNDGVVISGNNRTMSSKLAAQSGNDKKYIEALKKKSRMAGIDAKQYENFKNPRLVFEVEHKGDYTTEEYAKFNKSGKKEKNNIEKAVELSKTMKTETISNLASKISDYDTLAEMWNNKQACIDFTTSLVTNGIVQQTELAKYQNPDGTLSDTGKDFVETLMVGSVLNENNIRTLSNPGAKKIRSKIIRAIVPLIDNKGLGNEYTFNSELNKAVAIAAEVSQNPDTFKTVKEYLDQGNMFEDKPDELTSKLAEIIHSYKEKDFADKMQDLEGGLRPAANGEFDIFLGECETRDSVLDRVLQIRSAVQKAIKEILRTFIA